MDECTKKAIAREREWERKIRWKKKISVERFLIITSVSIPYSLESHPCFDFLGIRCVFPVISIVSRAFTIATHSRFRITLPLPLEIAHNCVSFATILNSRLANFVYVYTQLHSDIASLLLIHFDIQLFHFVRLFFVVIVGFSLLCAFYLLFAVHFFFAFFSHCSREYFIVLYTK